MPIEILKFIYKELTIEDNFNWKILLKIPSSFWKDFWSSPEGVVESLCSFKLDVDILDGLQKLRRLQSIIDLANCVFDKLNEHSQKNIKEIKLIYEGGVNKLKKVLTLLNPNFVQGSSHALIKKAKELSYDEMKNLPLCSGNGSLMSECYIGNNGFVASA